MKSSFFIGILGIRPRFLLNEPGLSQVSAPKLASFALGAAMRRAGLEPQEVEMVVLGHALPAGAEVVIMW